MDLIDPANNGLGHRQVRRWAREYFDCADHTVILSHVAVAEHLSAAAFDSPRFRPGSCHTRSAACYRHHRC